MSRMPASSSSLGIPPNHKLSQSSHQSNSTHQNVISATKTLNGGKKQRGGTTTVTCPHNPPTYNSTSPYSQTATCASASNIATANVQGSNDYRANDWGNFTPIVTPAPGTTGGGRRRNSRKLRKLRKSRKSRKSRKHKRRNTYKK